MREVWRWFCAIARFVLPVGRLGQPEFGLVISGLMVAELGWGTHLLQPFPLYLWFCAVVNRLRDVGRHPAWLVTPLIIPILVTGFLWVALLSVDNADGSQDGGVRAIAFGGMILIPLATLVSYLIFTLGLAFIPGRKRDGVSGAGQAATASQKPALRP